MKSWTILWGRDNEKEGNEGHEPLSDAWAKEPWKIVMVCQLNIRPTLEVIWGSWRTLYALTISQLRWQSFLTLSFNILPFTFLLNVFPSRLLPPPKHLLTHVALNRDLTTHYWKLANYSRFISEHTYKDEYDHSKCNIVLYQIFMLFYAWDEKFENKCSQNINHYTHHCRCHHQWWSAVGPSAICSMSVKKTKAK